MLKKSIAFLTMICLLGVLIACNGAQTPGITEDVFEEVFLEITPVAETDRDLELRYSSTKHPKASISWRSSALSIITNRGEVRRPDERTTVEMIATVTIDGEFKTRRFPVDVLPVDSVVFDLNAYRSDYGFASLVISNRASMKDQVVEVSTPLEFLDAMSNKNMQRKVNDELTAAHTVSIFADDSSAYGVVGITDKLKPTSKEAIRELQRMGIDVAIYTGDNEKVAAALAKELGITRYKGGVLPEEKADEVKRLQHMGRKVAMVGDGINDSGALAQADVSIAMGAGSDIAMDVAKMTIISSDLTKIPKAIHLSKATVKTIRQNLFWAFIYNVIGIPIAAGVLYPFTGFLLNPMIAGAAMALSSVSVVTNSLRLKTKKI